LAGTISIEESSAFSPRFDDRGLIPVFVVHAKTGEGLMAAWMNHAALEKTLATGFAHYWSRSRNCLWRKGETSGESQRVLDILTDCDQDTLLLRVETEGRGATCHTGRRSCFYRRLHHGPTGITLETIDDHRLFEPMAVYGIGRDPAS
jgi:phosphoribosyl-AMP cyclohydrolase